MATHAERRLFNQCVKRFCRALQRALGAGPKDSGLRLNECADEGGSTRLHAHAVYVGPEIPHEWLGEGKRLSEIWREACRGRGEVFGL